MNHVVCYSGGHSSALVAVEVVRRFGLSSVVLLNHDICPRIEDADVKRFKAEVAAALGVPVTQADHPRCQEWDQFDVCVAASAFQVKPGQALCTHRLKTEPFHRHLATLDPSQTVVYYGFDASEQHRIQRRSTALAALGFRSDYPLALWPRTIASTTEIGVAPPLTYGTWRHANCCGCLKAGAQHWYLVWLHRRELWDKAKWAEERIGHTILDAPLVELESRFAAMQCAGVSTTEHEHPQTFAARVRRELRDRATLDLFAGAAMPCECAS